MPQSFRLPLLTPDEQAGLRPELVDPVEYRKSGLSLNHVIGCPLDCAYCVRHLFDNFGMREPRALLSDAAAAEYLVRHPYFTPDRTPLQLFNRATDPFLAEVKPHTFAVLEDLDGRGLRNHVLVITRYHVSAEDCRRLNALSSLKVTLLFTYSGIDDARIEPVASSIAARSLRVAYEHSDRYRALLYWRPIVPGLNDSDTHLHRARDLSRHAHATVFTGCSTATKSAPTIARRVFPSRTPMWRGGRFYPRRQRRACLQCSQMDRAGRSSARPRAASASHTGSRTTTVITGSARCATSAPRTRLRSARGHIASQPLARCLRSRSEWVVSVSWRSPSAQPCSTASASSSAISCSTPSDFSSTT